VTPLAPRLQGYFDDLVLDSLETDGVAIRLWSRWLHSLERRSLVNLTEVPWRKRSVLRLPAMKLWYQVVLRDTALEMASPRVQAIARLR